MSCDLVRLLSRRSVLIVPVAAICLLACSGAFAQTARVLYTWDGTGDQRGWGPAFGDQNGVVYDNNLAGALRVSESAAHGGTSYAFADDANRLDDANVGSGGLDLFGLDAIEFDLGLNNSDGTPVNVAFYVQASAGFNFINLPDNPIPDTNAAPNTYSFPLNLLTDAQKAHIRFIGIEVRAHTGNASWRLTEVRSVGAGAEVRRIATHSPGSVENGYNGGRINFDHAAVLGNNGSGQSGLSVANGAMSWTDIGNGGDPNVDSGAAISYQNGLWPYAGNDFESRPHDNTNYNYVTFRMRATDDPNDPDADSVLQVQGFTQTTNAYNYNVLADLELPVDGQYHDVTYPLGAFKNAYTNNVSVNFQAHGNNVLIDIDSVTYHIPEPASMALSGLALACLGISRRRLK